MLPDILARVNPKLVSQHFGIYAMRPDIFASVLSYVKARLAEHVAERLDDPGSVTEDDGLYANRDGIAVINFSGPILKYGSSLGDASAVRLRRAVRTAAADATVRGLLMRIDSPGGSVSGLDDLARDFYAAGAIKPTLAYCEDCACSAALYVATQANAVWANPTAAVGSIGCLMVIEDYAAAFSEAGVKVYVVKSGAFKGMGTPGTEVTPEQLGIWQRDVSYFAEQFIQSVAVGRGMSADAVRELATGMWWDAETARGLGLVDQVGSIDAAFASLVESVQRGETRMSKPVNAGPTAADPEEPKTAAVPPEPDNDEEEEETEDAKPATATAPAKAAAAAVAAVPGASIADLRQACVGASDTFILSAFERSLSKEQAMQEFIAELSKGRATTATASVTYRERKQAGAAALTAEQASASFAGLNARERSLVGDSETLLAAEQAIAAGCVRTPK